MKKIQFTSAYDGYRVNEIASFDDNQANAYVTLGVATLIGDTARQVPEFLSEVPTWSAGETIVAAHTPYTFCAMDPIDKINKLYQLEAQAADWTTGVSFNPAEEALYVEVCSVEDLSDDGDVLKVGAGNVALNRAIIGSKLDDNFRNESSEEKAVRIVAQGAITITNDHGGQINLDGAIVASATLAMFGLVEAQFDGDDLYLMSTGTSTSGGGASTFLALTDTPAAFGTAGDSLIVNAAGNAVEIKTTQYKHTQAVASSVWNVTHNLNDDIDSVNVYVGNRKVFAQVDIVDANNLTVTFATSQSGYAIIEL